jgi:ABC-type phosphate transport system auxiliary subunit
MIVITFVSVSNSSFDKVQSDAQSEIKNVVIIIVKMCTICEKKYHTTNEHREQLNLKRDRDQFDEKRDDRDSKRRRKNDNDDDERINSKIDDEEEKHKIYIVISLEILTIMSAMFRQIAY